MRRRDFIAGLGVATKMHEHYRRKVATSQRNPNQPFGAIAPVAKGRRQPPLRWS